MRIDCHRVIRPVQHPTRDYASGNRHFLDVLSATRLRRLRWGRHSLYASRPAGTGKEPHPDAILNLTVQAFTVARQRSSLPKNVLQIFTPFDSPFTLARPVAPAVRDGLLHKRRFPLRAGV